MYDHRQFIAWQRADDVRRLVRGLTARPEFTRHLWLRTQLRRAANSSCTNIAEGFLRFSPGQFARFLEISKASLGEILEHMPDVVSLGLASEEESTQITRLAKRGIKATARLILYLESLPPNQVDRFRRSGQRRHEAHANPREPPEPKNPQEP